MALPTLHAPAPPFTLPDANGKMISLEDFLGKKNVLLIFYPGDMTPGCSLQLCSIRDDWSKFEKTNSAIFGINHGSAESHKAFAQKCHFPFPLLVDRDKKVSTAYGALTTILGRKIIRRTVVVINTAGLIVYSKHGMPKNSDILKAIHT